MFVDKPIDAVVLWVDGSDKEWQKEKAKYMGGQCKSSLDECRFREWGIFKYWFRAIEKNIPWIRTVHLVTNGQLPNFIDVNCPKLHLVKHLDIIPQEYLPTFSSRAIEVNIHRIEGLSDQFIYFNDDTYVMNPMKETDFFKGGLPRYEGLEALPRTVDAHDTYFHSVFNDGCIINKHFQKYKVFKKHFSKFFNLRYGVDNLRNLALLPWNTFQCFTNRHMPMPYLKQFYDAVWEAEPEILQMTTSHRFREYSDVNQHVFRYWGIASGMFHPIHTDGQAYHLASADIDMVIRDILKGKKKMLCINDGRGITNLETKIKRIVEAFDTRFPQKSCFEL